MATPPGFLLSAALGQRCLPAFSLAAFAVALTACDQGPTTRVLEIRLEDLEKKVKAAEQRAESAMLASETGTQDLDRRLETAEQRGQEALTQTSTLVTQNETRFQRIEQSLNNVMRIKQESEAVAYLAPNSPGHRTLQTDHGTFLVRLERIDRNPLGGFTAVLNLGNTMGLEIQEFRLKGDFGAPAPKLQPGEAYGDFSQRLDEWQKTLTPFEVGLVDVIGPNAWTQVELPLSASTQEELQLIRVAMTVQRARLANQDGQGEFSVVNVDSDGAGLVKTEYGPLLMTVSSTEPQGSVTRVRVMVGNPFGFVINEGALTGQFGPAPPRKMESESQPLYQKRLQLWSEQMKDFKTTLTGSIQPLSWSQASFVLPTSDVSQIKYLRLQLQVTNITLPRQGPSTGAAPLPGGGAF